MFLETLKRFARAESGAITSDFVMLTGAIAGLGIGVALLITPGIRPALSGVDPAMEASTKTGNLIIERVQTD